MKYSLWDMVAQINRGFCPEAAGARIAHTLPLDVQVSQRWAQLRAGDWHSRCEAWELAVAWLVHLIGKPATVIEYANCCNVVS